MSDVASFRKIREALEAKPTPAGYPHCCAWHESQPESYRVFSCR